MGEESKMNPEAETTVAVEQVGVPEAEKSVSDKVDQPAIVDEEKITKIESFNEETNVVTELPDSHNKAFDEFKKLIREALDKRHFSEEKKKEVEPPKTEEEAPKTEEEAPKTEEEETPKEEEEEVAAVEVVKTEEKEEDEEVEKTVEAIKETIVEEPPKEAAATVEEVVVPVVEAEEVSIWGIPLLADERSDVILLKFLRARDFKVKDAFTMIKNTVKWRKEFGVDELLDEDLGNDYEKVVFTHGSDKKGRPVCYNVLGEFQNEQLYKNTFADSEKRNKFLKWLIQFVEKTIRTLDFSPKGINSFVLVNDLNNSPGFGKRDVYKVIDKFLQILHDNYPEFVAKQLCINVSWWYLAYNWVYLTVFTPRSKSKFVFASPSKTPETIFKYIGAEQVPVQFGGHSKEGNHEFTTDDAVTQVTIKPGTKHVIDLPVSEATEETRWELRVIGWEVRYGAEFVPEKEGCYTLNIAKPRKVGPSDEPVICDTFKVSEPGKVVITIDNQSSKKKKLLYRSKLKASH